MFRDIVYSFPTIFGIGRKLPMLETLDYILIMLAGLCAFALIVLLSLGKPPRNPEVTPRKTKRGLRNSNA
jgi:hypothetical protein